MGDYIFNSICDATSKSMESISPVKSNIEEAFNQMIHHYLGRYQISCEKISFHYRYKILAVFPEPLKLENNGNIIADKDVTDITPDVCIVGNNKEIYTLELKVANDKWDWLKTNKFQLSCVKINHINENNENECDYNGLYKLLVAGKNYSVNGVMFKDIPHYYNDGQFLNDLARQSQISIESKTVFYNVLLCTEFAKSKMNIPDDEKIKERYKKLVEIYNLHRNVRSFSPAITKYLNRKKYQKIFLNEANSEYKVNIVELSIKKHNNMFAVVAKFAAAQYP